jgi:hypothetical protein
MISKTEQIRALNDELRQTLRSVPPSSPPVSPLSALRPSHASLKPSPCTMISATRVTRTRNTTLGRLRSMVRRSFSRSIITIRGSPPTRPTQLIRRSPSASSPSCWPKSIEGRLLAVAPHAGSKVADKPQRETKSAATCKFMFTSSLVGTHQ